MKKFYEDKQTLLTPNPYNISTHIKNAGTSNATPCGSSNVPCCKWKNLVHLTASHWLNVYYK